MFCIAQEWQNTVTNTGINLIIFSNNSILVHNLEMKPFR